MAAEDRSSLGARSWCLGSWALQDLNLGPTDYESAALTAELRARATLSNIECRTAANRWALTTADFPRPALPIHPARKVGPETLERCVQGHGRRCREHAAEADGQHPFRGSRGEANTSVDGQREQT